MFFSLNITNWYKFLYLSFSHDINVSSVFLKAFSTKLELLSRGFHKECFFWIFSIGKGNIAFSVVLLLVSCITKKKKFIRLFLNLSIHLWLSWIKHTRLWITDQQIAASFVGGIVWNNTEILEWEKDFTAC